MKKINWKKGAVAAVTAGLMLSALPTMAFAATVTAQDAGQDIVKNWTVASASQYSASESFTFKLTYDGDQAATQVGSYDIVAPTGIGAEGKTVELSGLTAVEGKANTYTKSTDLANIFSGVNFSSPGQYQFTLQEVAGSNKNITYSKQSYKVRVDVVSNTDGSGAPTGVAKINGVYILGTETVDGLNGKASSAVFDNTAADNQSLTVSKHVAGTAANTDDDFTFTVTVNNATGTYAVTGDVAASTTITAGKAQTFTLKNGQEFVINNLPVGATYTVTETETDYTETHKANTDKGYVGDDADTKDVNEGLESEGTIAKGTNSTVDFKNEKGFAPETGITMNTLPFVGVAAVAVAGGVSLVISRNRRQHEDF